MWTAPILTAAGLPLLSIRQTRKAVNRSLQFKIRFKKGANMYSPKVQEVLIPILYRWGKKKGVPMTVLVNRIIAKEIKKQKRKGGELYEG